MVAEDCVLRKLFNLCKKKKKKTGRDKEEVMKTGRTGVIGQMRDGIRK